MTGSIEEGYVTGLEPATNYPNSKAFERKKGRVHNIPPDGTFTAMVVFQICSTNSEVKEVLKEIKEIQSTAQPIISEKAFPELSEM